MTASLLRLAASLELLLEAIDEGLALETVLDVCCELWLELLCEMFEPVHADSQSKLLAASNRIMGREVEGGEVRKLSI